MEAWHAPATGERGGQPIYSAIAIETGLALRLVFHQPLRQTEGMLRSIAAVLGVDIAIPDHTTLSRRGGGLTILPNRVDRDEPLHLLVDSTGLKIYGEGEWLDQKHGIRSRRRWRKLHLGVDAGTHEIVAVELTPDDVGDVSEVPELLDQIDADVASLTADGAYDGGAVYDAVAERHPEAAVIIPPRTTAVPSATTTTQRDRHLAAIAKHGRIALAAQFGLQSPELGRNCGVSIQDHHRPASSRSDSAQSTDRSEDRMQRAQPDDKARHAGLRPDRLNTEARRETLPSAYSCTNARGRTSIGSPRPGGRSSSAGAIACHRSRKRRCGSPISLRAGKRVDHRG